VKVMRTLTNRNPRNVVSKAAVRYANVFLNNVGGMPSKRYFNPKYVKATNLEFYGV
jgi:hypothetical protein